ncbi:DUF1800 domain-containing protein [Tellurirhabdus rosea]|uniref:DUF1800 domain-containing protein n=1 Tax=Tellurirhabdus rosea TaxID=2674997 RepID=UPI0022548A00|nr:DUF1800 domain-containing protein [Tellurirhabdus rosea]
MSLLLPVTEPLSTPQAAHLLRRATFGASSAHIRQFTGLTPGEAVQRLLADTPAAPAPLDPATGQTIMDKAFNRNLSNNLLKGWWLGLMLTEPVSLREKTTLFWQNHFVSTIAEVQDYRFMHRQNVMLRRNAFGNFRTFVMEVTKEPAMLRYLNGNQNVVGRPNENYARELLELFTIGRNNYNEDDVKAAARVLTGWADTGFRNETTATFGSLYRPNQHDTTGKTFSSFFQSTVIQGRSGDAGGDLELGELIDMILRQPETARNIVRKMYRWFINADLTAEIEKDFIEPLAQVFRQNQYEIKPVLTALFTSRHFFDTNLKGAIIKSPLELIVGSWRTFGMSVPDYTKETTNFYALANTLLTRSREQQMDVLDQPTVFGYKPYYDTGYYEIWINSNTLAMRGGYTDSFINGNIRVSNVRQIPNLLPLVAATSDPADAVKMIDELTGLVLAVDLSRSQKDFLIDQVLVPGLPRYVWSDEWNNYRNDPTNTVKQMAVQMKLTSLMQYVFRMAEFQMT